jgi:2,4-diaminopentanoate dehydrogenase
VTSDRVAGVTPAATLHVGLGQIGAEILKVATASRWTEPVAIVDPRLVRGAGAAALPIYATAAEAAREIGRADWPSIALHATSSSVETVAPQILELIELGCDVISTCEELTSPWDAHSRISEEIDARARMVGRRVIALGVNPGFVMDALPLFMTGVMSKVHRIRVSRAVDTAKRRGALQEKTGAGLSLEEFDERCRAGNMGHVGLRESMLLLAHGLGWKLEKDSQTLEPYANATGSSVLGIRQTAKGSTLDGHELELSLEMALGHPKPQDTLELDGEPPISVLIHGGVHGDMATAAIVVNAVAGLGGLAPGLRTVVDLIGARA